MKTFLDQLASRSFRIGSLNAPQTKLPRARLAVICGVIFLTTLGVRVLYWQDNFSDYARGPKSGAHRMLMHFYHEQAQRMLGDGGLVFPSKDVDPGDSTILAHPPGYSILIVGLLKMSQSVNSKQAVKQAEYGLSVLQIVAEAISSVVIFLIAAELVPAGIAIIAALLSSFSPHFAYYSILLAPDTLVVLPVLLAIYFLIRASKRPRMITIIASGALIGLSCWLRPNALLLAPFLVIIIPLLFERRTRLRYSLVLVCATIVTIAPIIIRNWIVFHRFIPLSASAGLLLIEGIGDYDSERRFGMPANDAEAVSKDVEWHGRPEYGDSLWKPDGIERDRERLKRGLVVVGLNPGWFLGVMLRRMEFMLRYNDFRHQELPILTIAPTLSVDPNFGHEMEIADDAAPVWSSSSSELANGAVNFGRAQVALEDKGATLQLTADGSHEGDLYLSEGIPVKKNSDYVLRLTISLEQGNVDAKIKTADPRIVLALVSAANSVKKRKPKTVDPDQSEPASTLGQPMKDLLVPFASGDNTCVQLSLYKPAPQTTIVRFGGAEMFESGPTPNLWTRYPRALIRGVQKNLFKTDVARCLIAIGVILLALARRWRALAILLIVPFYFLLIQSSLHTEYRYILTIHYFLFAISAVTIYYAGAVISQGLRRVHALEFRRRLRVC